MSKSSKPSELEVVGLDISDRSSALCVLNGHGEIVEETSLKTTHESFKQCFAGRRRMRIVLEVGPQSPWISRYLQRLGHDVMVVNGRQLRLIADSLQKTDRSDARTLALIGRLGEGRVRTIQHRRVETQAALSLLHCRALAVAHRTALMNQVRGMVKAAGYGTLPQAKSASTFVELVAGVIPEGLRPSIDGLLVLIVHQGDVIRSYDQAIRRMVAEHPVARTLEQQIKGVGPQTTLAFVLTIEDPARFRRSRDIGAYLGLVPRQRQSGTSKPDLHITKAGDKLLRRLLVQCAHYVISRGPDCELQQWARTRIGSSKRQRKLIVVAVARKLAVLLHRLWVTGEAYDPFYHQHRRAATQGETSMTATAA